EQRFGRIHRIGQTEVCHLWNLVSKETREGLVFQRLLEKLEQERETLNGKVFDVLGDVTFDNKPLRDLLIEAIRYGNDPEVRDRLNQVVDKAFDPESIRQLIEDHALTEDSMDVHKVMAIREEMERMEAHKLQPYFIEAFFLEAFANLGGKLRPREKGRYEITHVPFAVRNRDMQIGFGEPVVHRYERVCFDKEYTNPPGLPIATLIAPGHPLLEATIDLIRERNSSVLKQGAIFVDENDTGTDLRLLFYIEDSVQDGKILPDGNKRVISKNIHFVERKADGSTSNAGYAPYLDYRAPTAEELPRLREHINAQTWLQQDVETTTMTYAISEIIPAHVAEVRQRKLKMLDKISIAVINRLTAEIQYWDFRAADLKTKEAAGKINAKLNSANASRRADDLQERLQSRLTELEKEKHISASPPVIVGGAIVVPRGLLDQISGTPAAFTADAQARRAVELTAMQTMMALEASLGHHPRDVSAQKLGYDIESSIPADLREPGSASLRFLEVKGRAAGAEVVTVSKNEILTGLNKPEEYILALVEVDGSNTKTYYLRQPFRSQPDFAATSVNYNISELIAGAQVIMKRG
ncbi:MAG: DUF3883 domain-containing protein, partial [Chloroflexi bacterium]|nr:DUF3883 domain-containing protein [Chloroflexota bacterium]